ncbi:hypothetical protein EC957_010153 [Mortierella hygrophila]|uniref:F-box domain-containing protein n=1 Tax=Mortierella hygrophila TaxID=979708 RepID=A0A9P6K500_9FUNG|nr:hypothetical protein EC957_010153 [Mortierella hygrophila]
MSTNPILMPTRAFYLPELLDLIGNDLNTRDLLSCVQVCRVWNQHFMPTLWATIDDKLYSWPKILSRSSPLASGFLHGNNSRLNNVFIKHGRHIRHLTAGWATTITSISSAGTVTGLESLSVVQPSGFSSESVFSVRGTTPLWIPPLLQDFLPPTTRKCKYRNLSVWDFVQKFWSLVIHNSSLKSIELAQECQLDDFPIPVPSLLKALATLRNLTKLVNNMAAIDLQMHTTALNLLRHLSNLDQLSFDGIWNFVHPPPGSTATGNGMLPDSRATVNNSNSSVQDFHFVRAGRVSSSSMRDFIALDILPRMPRLTRLTLQTLTQTAGKALAKHCSQLEWLQLRTTKYDSMDQDSITPLLHHCSRLRHLDAIWHTVEANSLVKKPVVCRGMEVFRCKITGIVEENEEEEEEEGHDNELEDGPWENPAEDYNSDDQEDEDEETTATKMQRRLLDHHQHIYDELGRWTELRVLELGVDNVDWYDIMGSDPGRHLVDGRIYYNYFGPTPNTLLLSLESGLNRLRTLKKLEVIGFEGVDHRINTGELAWMAENWPKLQVMHGFQAPDGKDEYALRCPKVKGLREYMQGLRPLVRHEPGQE